MSHWEYKKRLSNLGSQKDITMSLIAMKTTINIGKTINSVNCEKKVRSRSNYMFSPKFYLSSTNLLL